jgi:hypothetical protein
MKLKLILSFFALAAHLNAANYLVTNVVTGDSGDTLFQSTNGTLLDGGIVALGYFASGGTPSSDLANISTTVSAFTITAFALTGTPSVDLGGSYAGYVQASQITGAAINNGDPLIGKSMYVFIGNSSSLSNSTSWALAQVQIIASDEPNPQTYTSIPRGLTPIIGRSGTFTGSAGGGTSATYQTLQLTAIPEPSVALVLGALSGFTMLRRRRI